VPRGMRLLRKEYARSRHQRLFEENVGKTGKDVVYKLEVKGSAVVFTYGEGISTPHVHRKGRQPLIKCANMTSICVIFPVFCLFMPFVFFIFLWSTRVFPLAPTYSLIVIRKSDLSSSLRTKRWLICFYPFFAKYVFIE